MANVTVGSPRAAENMAGRAALMALVAMPLALFAFLQASPDLDLKIEVHHEHFYIVGMTTALAVVMAATVLYTALRLHHAPTLLLGLGFLSIAGIFLLHGLNTPDVLFGPNRVGGISARLSLLTGSFFFAASAWIDDTRLSRAIVRFMPLLLLAWIAILVVYGAFGLFYQTGFDWISIVSGPLSWILAAITILLFAAAAMGYWQRFERTHLALSGALAIAAVLLLDAQIPMAFGTA